MKLFILQEPRVEFRIHSSNLPDYRKCFMLLYAIAKIQAFHS